MKLSIGIDSQPLRELSLSPQLILLDDVQCTGSESSLLECSRSPLGDHDCDGSSGAGVRCAGKSSLYSSKTCIDACLNQHCVVMEMLGSVLEPTATVWYQTLTSF